MTSPGPVRRPGDRAVRPADSEHAGHGGHTEHAGHAGHAHVEHGIRLDADRRYLLAALALIVALMVAELVTGLVAHSLALITGAGHMVTDAAAIGLALMALRLAARPATGAFTYGLKRAEILSAQINGLTLAGLVVYFCYEAVHRLIDPPVVEGRLVLGLGIVGIAVNVAATWLLGRANRRSLNVEGAFQHILTDLYAFVATAVAGLVVWLTGFDRADAIAALVVAGLMAVAAYRLLRDSGRVLFEATPHGIDAERVDNDIHAVADVREVHDLHIWEVTSGFPALSAHILVGTGADCHERRAAVERMLAERYGIDHTTLQVEHRADVVPLEGLRVRLDGEPPPDGCGCGNA